MEELHSVLIIPMVLMASSLLPPSSLRRLENGRCHAPCLCILCTVPPHVPLTDFSCPISNFSFLDINFVVSRGFVGLLGQDLVLGSHAVSFQSPKLQLRWITPTVTTSFLSSELVTLQIMHGVVHPSRSCWICESYSSVSHPDPKGSRLEASWFP